MAILSIGLHMEIVISWIQAKIQCLNTVIMRYDICTGLSTILGQTNGIY